MKRMILLIACLGLLLLPQVTSAAASVGARAPQAAIAVDCSSYPDDATTLATRPIVNSSNVLLGQVALRFSPSCRLAWARTTSSSGPATLWSEIRRSDGYALSTTQSYVTELRSPTIYVPIGSCVIASGSFVGIGGASTPTRCP